MEKDKPKDGDGRAVDTVAAEARITSEPPRLLFGKVLAPAPAKMNAR